MTVRRRRRFWLAPLAVVGLLLAARVYGDDVHVRGYHRKDGTYVHGYTRHSHGAHHAKDRHARHSRTPTPIAETQTETDEAAAGLHPHCKTGKPCGHTCIAKNKACRLEGAGSGAYRNTGAGRTPTPTPTPTAAPAPRPSGTLAKRGRPAPRAGGAGRLPDSACQMPPCWN